MGPVSDPPGGGFFSKMKLGASAREFAAVKLADVDGVGLERRLQDRDGGVGRGGAAHEDIKRRKADFGPSVTRDMGFRQDRHGGDTLGGEAVGMDVKEGGAGGCGGVAQGLFDEGLVVEVVGVVEVDDEVRAGVGFAVLGGEVRGWRGHGRWYGGGDGGGQAGGLFRVFDPVSNFVGEGARAKPVRVRVF